MKAKEKRNNANKEKQQSPEDSLAKEKPTYGNNPNEGTQIAENKKQHFFPNWYNLSDPDKIQSTIAIVAVVTFIVISISVYVQSCQTRQALSYADTSNQFTRQSIQLARDNFIIENRPWLGIENIKLVTLSAAEIPSVYVTVKNYGKMPATEFSGHLIAELHSIPTYNKFEYPPKERTRESIAVLPPGEVRSSIVYCRGGELKKSYLKAILNGKLFLYVYGKITYTDIFNTKGTTTFCFLYEPLYKDFNASAFYNTME